MDVVARLVIGTRQRLLAVRSTAGEPWLLPGRTLVDGEPVETTVRRVVEEDLSTTATFVAFLALVEDCYAGPDGQERHELALLFDVGLRSTQLRLRDRLERRWVKAAEVTALSLRPAGVGMALVSGRFDDGDRWAPWRPDERTVDCLG